MWFSRKKGQQVRQEVRRHKNRLNDGTLIEESRLRLDKPLRNAVWGTTTLIGKQKK